jgi:hypothetical protein
MHATKGFGNIWQRESDDFDGVMSSVALEIVRIAALY